jgi:hypothetical protein
MIGVSTTGTVKRMVSVNGEDFPQVFRETNIRNGRVLLLKGERHSGPVVDRYGEIFQGMAVELDFGYRTNCYSSDPEKVQQMLSLKHDDRVNVTGIRKKSGAVRITHLERVPVEAAAVASLVLVPLAAA